jgi:hypothetical protein
MYVNRLRAEMRTSRVSIMAHSLGNAVAGSALRGGMTIDSYVAMEAAVSLSCYFAPPAPGEPDALLSSHVPDLVDEERRTVTPDRYTELGYRGYLRDLPGRIEGKVTAYQNIDDFWLATGTTRARLKKVDWVSNQKAFKPNNLHGLSIFKAYAFYPNRAPNSQCVLSVSGIGNDRIVEDPHEAMAYIARARTRALGAEPQGSNSRPPAWTGVINMKTYNFGAARPDHSGQFQRNIQLMYGNDSGVSFEIPFFRQLLDDLALLTR